MHYETTIQYKVFDKTFQNSTHIYGINRYEDANKHLEVRQNYHNIKNNLSVEHLVVLEQVFGSTVIDADTLEDYTLEPEGDAIVITKPGVAIAIQTADCVPVLLFDHEQKIIAGVHCAWKCCLENILEKTVSLMKQKGAKNICAVIGPAIQQKNYEVDRKFYDMIIQFSHGAVNLFLPSVKENHFLFDLPGFVAMQLYELGIIDVLNDCEDTYSDDKKYFSYRRDCHLGILDKNKKTNILSTILITK